MKKSRTSELKNSVPLDGVMGDGKTTLSPGKVRQGWALPPEFDADRGCVNGVMREREYLTERELAKRWGIAVKTLQNRRVRGGFLRFAKIGSSVRYAIADVEAYEIQARRNSTSDEGQDD